MNFDSIHVRFSSYIIENCPTKCLQNSKRHVKMLTHCKYHMLKQANGFIVVGVGTNALSGSESRKMLTMALSVAISTVVAVVVIVTIVVICKRRR